MLLTLAGGARAAGDAGAAGGGEAPAIGWQEAIARLAAERTRAETCAALLKKHGDEAALSEGAGSYGEAKAEVDGVIAGLAVALSRDARADPASLPDLEAKLRRAFDGREAFCARTNALVPPAQPGEKTLLIEVVGAVAQPLVEAIKAIWLDARHADRLTAATIQTQLEATRWPAFASVAPSP